jgi:glycine cleavage system aminomethyltransferase T
LTGPNTTFWPVFKDPSDIFNANNSIGKITSAVYSPRLELNIALAMMSTDCVEIGTEVNILTPQGLVQAVIVERPFYDPKKQLAVVKVA